jgi:hypothetical protein
MNFSALLHERQQCSANRIEVAEMFGSQLSQTARVNVKMLDVDLDLRRPTRQSGIETVGWLGKRMRLPNDAVHAMRTHRGAHFIDFPSVMSIHTVVDAVATPSR